MSTKKKPVIPATKYPPNLKTLVESCSFVGTQWDAKAINSIDIVARSLVENAAAAARNADAIKEVAIGSQKLAALFQAQHINTPLLAIDGRDGVGIFDNILNSGAAAGGDNE